MALHAGDKVILKPNLKIGKKYDNWEYRSSIKHYQNQILTVAYVENLMRGFLFTTPESPSPYANPAIGFAMVIPYKSAWAMKGD